MVYPHVRMDSALTCTGEMAEPLSLIDCLPVTKKDHLELEIAERLSKEHKETVDELQLAALLGKTLLEKNGELEMKLKTLQDFAEETLIAKQTLSRQLNESRESLQFSNGSCEQLEVKVEELERANHELQKICDNKQNEIEKRTARIQDLGSKLQTLELEHRTFRDSHSNLKQNGESDNVTVKAARKRSSEFNSFETFRGDVPVLPTPAETADLQNTIDMLTLNLQNASYQRQRVEGELKRAMAENQALSKNLNKAEAEINELHKSLKSCEEVFDKQSLENSLKVPLPGVSTPTLISGSQDHYCCTSPENDGAGSTQSTQRPPKLNESELGASLFSELDTQYTVLQQQYKELLHDCTCSASLSHRHRHRESFEQVETDGATAHSQSVQLDKPFKQLFDEVFATLKQTAQVADRLIERRSYAK